jgi:hypothetical protein
MRKKLREQLMKWQEWDGVSPLPPALQRHLDEFGVVIDETPVYEEGGSEG